MKWEARRRPRRRKPLSEETKAKISRSLLNRKAK